MQQTQSYSTFMCDNCKKKSVFREYRTAVSIHYPFYECDNCHNQQITHPSQNEMAECHIINCKNFTFRHRSMFIHSFRERKCKYFPCKLFHDPDHLLDYTHVKHYKHTANYNLEYNTKSIIYVDDIWNNIHNNIIKSGTSSRFRIGDHIQTIQTLLCTSKIFRILLHITTEYINSYQYDNGCVVYGHSYNYDTCGQCYAIKEYCHCSRSCHACFRYFDDSY